MSLKTIKIFLASSSELKADRDEFRIFISRENDRLHKQGIYLEILQWEYFLDAISDTRLGILRRVTMLFRGKRSMCLAGGRVQQMLFQRFKVSY
jgi:hypothetical protein